MASSVSHELEGNGHADDTMFRPISAERDALLT